MARRTHRRSRVRDGAVAVVLFTGLAAAAGCSTAGPPPQTGTPSSAVTVTSHSPGDQTAASETAVPPLSVTSPTAVPSTPATLTTQPAAVTSVTVTGTIATGLTTPWGVGFLPDGTALVTERDTGRLLAISPGDAPAVRTVGSVDGVVPNGEGGLLGLAVSPDFGTDRTVYVYYTAASDNRIAALTLDAGATAIAGQQVILSGIPSAAVHNGGRLLAAPDGSLFVGTGDATVKADAQSLDSLGGKILHISGDGSAAPGNPFPQAPLVYSYGHRNVQGLAFDDQGPLWASEFGQNAYDELNLIRPGGNYGWPDVEGPSDDSRFVPPYRYWPTSDASPSGLAIVGDTALMATLRGQRLWLIPLGGAGGSAEPVATLAGEYGRLRTVLPAPDGSVWLTTSNTDGRGDVQPGDDRILRLSLG
jgi:glucose/arabinose dehydrogenase